MSKHTESLWLCTECGEQKELASCTWKSLFPSVSADLAIPHHSHGRRSEQRWVPAEEVEVIPVADFEGFKERLRKQVDRMYAESGDPQLNEFAQQQAQFDADRLSAAIKEAEQESPHGS